MLKNNFKIFLRSIKKHKGIFLINLIGLSTGLACVLLITLWVFDELQFDKFHENDDRLYQVWNQFEESEGISVRSWTPDLLAETMVDKFPEVEQAVAQTLPEWFSKTPLFADGKTIKAPGIFASEDYFEVFSYEMEQGNKSQALQDVNSITISESLANRLFGNTHDVIGKVIDCDIMGIKDKHQVTGVFKDVPSNSTTQFDFVLSFKSWKKKSAATGREISWVNNAPSTYIVLKEGTNVDQFAAKIKNFSKTQSSNVEADLILTQYSSNYLFGNFENGKQTSGRMDYVYLFAIIAFFILLIACINYMNLSTANASRRLKEIGTKKALGSQREKLIAQFFGESVSTALVALLVSIFLVLIIIPEFNQITGKELSLNFGNTIIAIILLVVVFTGLLAGSYPALYLSRFSPTAILRGRMKNSLSELWIRKGLVVFQFALSIILIVVVFVVSQQVDFIQSKDLGMNKDNVVYFLKEGGLQVNSESFLNEIKSVPGVVNAATTNQNIVGTEISTTSGLLWSGNEDDANKVFHNIQVGNGFIETMSIQVKEGRSFSKDYSTDNTAIVFNEMAIKTMGIDNPIGKTVQYVGNSYTIIGVLKDFHFQSLQEEVKPMFFRLNDNPKISEILVRIEKGREREVLDNLERIYQRFNPGYLFEYTFLDKNFQAQYIAEQRVGVLSKYFAGLAIIVSCLGLFGLATFTAERRRKEISVRKVLGQSAKQIVIMLSSEFAKLVLVAILIALPIAYILTNNWLTTFAYRIPLSLLYFLGAGLIALLVALLTVGGQAIITANNNPIKALREE
ncbi:ABC transporter permease [Aquimarina sp. 2304DJ70-9]|uniref:ABC transporter permease n=1 Tax=Aquimarina penaris TaxID=3231044 RepID=UPI003462FD2F